jgi:hypothetical protein
MKTHIHPAPKLRLSGALPLFPISAFMARTGLYLNDNTHCNFLCIFHLKRVLQFVVPRILWDSSRNPALEYVWLNFRCTFWHLESSLRKKTPKPLSTTNSPPVFNDHFVVPFVRDYCLGALFIWTLKETRSSSVTMSANVVFANSIFFLPSQPQGWADRTVQFLDV